MIHQEIQIRNLIEYRN